jgi:hypothetical protein
MITQNRLKEVLDYNPITGIFIRKIRINKVKAGSIAGTKTAQGYLSVSIDGRPYLLHRLVILFMTGSFPEKQVDHINGIRTDNRWMNIRNVSVQENSFNRVPNKNRELQVKNVYWIPKLKRYRVKMKINKITTHFGYYDDLELAELVAKEAQQKYHGVYARNI